VSMTERATRGRYFSFARARVGTAAARGGAGEPRTRAFRGRTSTAKTLSRGGTCSAVSRAPRSCRETRWARARRASPRGTHGAGALTGKGGAAEGSERFRRPRCFSWAAPVGPQENCLEAMPRNAPRSSLLMMCETTTSRLSNRYVRNHRLLDYRRRYY
jgi:hypothetical protein